MSYACIYRFVDPGMVIISNPRRFSPLMAEASFKRKIIGTAARALKASKYWELWELSMPFYWMHNQSPLFAHKISPPKAKVSYWQTKIPLPYWMVKIPNSRLKSHLETRLCFPKHFLLWWLKLSLIQSWSWRRNWRLRPSNMSLIPLLTKSSPILTKVFCTKRCTRDWIRMNPL